MTAAEQERLAVPEGQPERSWEDEVEFRALSWCTDFADPDRGRRWAGAGARTATPINYAANRALMADSRRRSDAELLDLVCHLGPPAWFLHGDRNPRPRRERRRTGRRHPGCAL